MMKNNVSCIEECTNCGACIASCPKNAIYVDDKNLFYKMAIDESKCVSCGKCLTVCPINKKCKGNIPIKAIAGWAQDEHIRSSSSSGGAFSVLASYIMERGGAIFSACYDADCRKVIFSSTDSKDMDDLRRSKYVESRTDFIFLQIKKELESGRLVMFCGTPCQVAGLTTFLGYEPVNLIKCDFACGGLPSHKLYSQYLQELQKKYHSRIVAVNFRPKTAGWEQYCIQITFLNGKKYERLAILDPYFYSFVYARVSIRPNCYHCNFTDNHFSDLSLADYWKYKDTPKIINDSKGISLIIANTNKGEEWLSKIRKDMITFDLDLDKATYNYKKKEVSSATLNQREKFIKKLSNGTLIEGATEVGMLTGITALKYSFLRELCKFKKDFFK